MENLKSSIYICEKRKDKVKFNVLYYEQTSPLGVSVYAVGQTKLSLRLNFAQFCHCGIFFSYPLAGAVKNFHFFTAPSFLFYSIISSSVKSLMLPSSPAASLTASVKPFRENR